MLGGIVLFCAGSLVGALAGDTRTLIAGRVVMGVGAAACEPGTLSLIRQIYPDRRERARALGVWTAVSGISLALGPVLGGVLVATGGWRAIFWFNLGFGATMLAAAARFVPESSDPEGRRLDLPGLVAGAVAVTGVTFAVIEGEDVGYGTWWVPLLFAAAAARVHPRSSVGLGPRCCDSSSSAVPRSAARRRLPWRRASDCSPSSSSPRSTSRSSTATPAGRSRSSSSRCRSWSSPRSARQAGGRGRAGRGADGARLVCSRARWSASSRCSTRTSRSRCSRWRSLESASGSASHSSQSRRRCSPMIRACQRRSGMAASTVNTSRQFGGVLAVAILGAVVNDQLVGELGRKLTALDVPEAFRSLVIDAVPTCAAARLDDCRWPISGRSGGDRQRSRRSATASTSRSSSPP